MKTKNGDVAQGRFPKIYRFVVLLLPIWSFIIAYGVFGNRPNQLRLTLDVCWLSLILIMIVRGFNLFLNMYLTSSELTQKSQVSDGQGIEDAVASILSGVAFFIGAYVIVGLAYALAIGGVSLAISTMEPRDDLWFTIGLGCLIIGLFPPYFDFENRIPEAYSKGP